MIEKFTDEEKEILLKELLEWKEKLNKERERELEDNAMANLKSNAKIIFDKYPKIHKIKIFRVGKAMDAPYECSIDDEVDFIGENNHWISSDDLGIEWSNMLELYRTIENCIPDSLLGDEEQANHLYPGCGIRSYIDRDLNTGWEDDNRF